MNAQPGSFQKVLCGCYSETRLTGEAPGRGQASFGSLGGRRAVSRWPEAGSRAALGSESTGLVGGLGQSQRHKDEEWLLGF